MKRLCIALTLTLLVGCGSVSVKDQAEAQLMPESVAKKILAQHIGWEWVNRPGGYPMLPLGGQCNRGELLHVPFDELGDIRFFKGLFNNPDVLQIMNKGWHFKPCRAVMYTVQGHFSEQDINDIINAFVSLGAQIKQEK